MKGDFGIWEYLLFIGDTMRYNISKVKNILARVRLRAKDFFCLLVFWNSGKTIGKTEVKIFDYSRVSCARRFEPLHLLIRKIQKNVIYNDKKMIIIINKFITIE